MNFYGLDIAGAKNTWLCRIRVNDNRITITEIIKHRGSIIELAGHINKTEYEIICIDAPLTYPADKENGMRDSDILLRDILKRENHPANIVSSSHSLMAVPLRGMYLLKYLKNRERIFETHPRATAYLMGLNIDNVIDTYKDRDFTDFSMILTAMVELLNNKGYMLESEHVFTHDGEVDSLLCALSGLFYRKGIFNAIVLPCSDNDISIIHYKPEYFVIKRDGV